MTRYEQKVMGEFEEAVRQTRQELASFLSLRVKDLEKAGGGSVNGAKTHDGKTMAFIAFGWGEIAADLERQFRATEEHFDHIETPKETIQ